MGLSRSLVDVDHENDRWCYVGCRSDDLLSYFFMYFNPILLFGFSDFYSFCLTVMVVFFMFILVYFLYSFSRAPLTSFRNTMHWNVLSWTDQLACIFLTT